MSKSSIILNNTANLKKLERTLLHHSALGVRDYTIWEISKVTLVSIQHLVRTKYNEVYNADGTPKSIAKLDGAGYFYLKPCWKTLRKYSAWLNNYNISSDWMFPSFPNSIAILHHKQSHITSSRFYSLLTQVGKRVGIEHLGNETPRRTGALHLYHQTHNIGLVMQMLHQKDLLKTRKFLGISGCNHAFIIHSLNKVAFN